MTSLRDLRNTIRAVSRIPRSFGLGISRRQSRFAIGSGPRNSRLTSSRRQVARFQEHAFSLATRSRERHCSAKTPPSMSLELRPNCECCDRDMPPDTREAMICTFGFWNLPRSLLRAFPIEIRTPSALPARFREPLGSSRPEEQGHPLGGNARNGRRSMHLLRAVRGEDELRLPELRRRTCATADPPGCEACEEPRIHGARPSRRTVLLNMLA